MKNVSVIAFYSFFRIDNLELLENQIQDFLQPIDIKGTILIGPEGLNGTIAIPLNEEKKTINSPLSIITLSKSLTLEKKDNTIMGIPIYKL